MLFCQNSNHLVRKHDPSEERPISPKSALIDSQQGSQLRKSGFRLGTRALIGGGPRQFSAQPGRPSRINRDQKWGFVHDQKWGFHSTRKVTFSRGIAVVIIPSKSGVLDRNQKWRFGTEIRLSATSTGQDHPHPSMPSPLTANALPSCVLSQRLDLCPAPNTPSSLGRFLWRRPAHSW